MLTDSAIGSAAQAHVLAEKTFASWDPFTHALSFGHRMQSLELWDDWCKWLNKHVNFLHEDLDVWQTLTMQHAVTLAVHNGLKRYHSKEDIKVMLFEMLKFTAPCCLSSSLLLKGTC